jgi:EpsI family protein
LDNITLAERRILPVDTIIKKKQYVDARGRSIYVSIVVSGAEQRSLHRPQQCLPAQGFVIDSGDVIQVPIANREPLEVMLLGLHWRAAAGSGGSRVAYAYWFAGGDRETASHIRRLFWMSRDRIIKGIVPRWAYITVSLQGDQGREADIGRLRDFISEFYPLIRADV